MSNKDLFDNAVFSVQTIEAIGKYLSLVQKFKTPHSFEPYVANKVRREFGRQNSFIYTGDNVELSFITEVGYEKVYTRYHAIVRSRMVTIKELTDILHKNKHLIK